MDSAGGTVGALWRYPVKSMRGEQVGRAAVGDRGVAGDRAYALIDAETGHIASAKNPRLWKRLFDCRAELLEGPDADGPPPPVLMTLPDGTKLRSDDAGVDDVLSLFVGRRVRLQVNAPPEPTLEEYWPEVEGVPDDLRGTVTSERIALLAPPGTFFDGAPVHVLTDATLAALSAAHPEGRFDIRRFRPNIVVTTGGAGFVENAWVDRTAALGDDVRLHVVLAVPRCVMTTLAQDDLLADKAILRTVARENRIDIPGLGPSSCVGVYGVVERAGAISVGDNVTIARRKDV